MASNLLTGLRPIETHGQNFLHFASLPTVLLYRLQQSLQGRRAQRWSDQGIARREDPAAVYDVQDELNGFTSVVPRFNGLVLLGKS